MNYPFVSLRSLAALCALGCLPTLVPTPAQAQAPPSSEKPLAGKKLLDAFRKGFERPHVPLDVKVISTETHDGFVHEKITVASEAGVRVPVLVIHREKITSHQPAVICLHGLGGNKDDLGGMLTEFAKRGFVGVAIDARYHGDRRGDLTKAMIDSYHNGKEHPYLFDTVWDTWRVLDYLETRSDVDKKRLGVMGISLGGHTTWMVSADPRVKVAVPIISVCSWRWQLENKGYVQRVKNIQGAFDAVATDLGEKEVTPKVVASAWEHWMPGIPRLYDCQDVLAAMSPRPLLILGGDSDPVAPIEGTRLAYNTISAAYHKAGADDQLQMIIAEHSGHAVTPEHTRAMYAWFEKWLKPTP